MVKKQLDYLEKNDNLVKKFENKDLNSFYSMK